MSTDEQPEYARKVSPPGDVEQRGASEWVLAGSMAVTRQRTRGRRGRAVSRLSLRRLRTRPRRTSSPSAEAASAPPLRRPCNERVAAALHPNALTDQPRQLWPP